MSARSRLAALESQESPLSNDVRQYKFRYYLELCQYMTRKVQIPYFIHQN